LCAIITTTNNYNTCGTIDINIKIHTVKV